MDATCLRSIFTLRRLFLGALAVAVVLVGLQYMQKSGEDRSAFNRWRDQIQGLDRGEDIYQLHEYPNAPVMALILYPLAHLPRVEIGNATLDLGALAWFLLKVGMTALAFRWTVQIVQSKELPFPPWAQAIALTLTLRPIVDDLSHGNVNLLILFLVTAALYAFRRERDWSAGLLLALAICCKVTPGLFLPYFVWKRAWKTVVGCLIGLGLFFFVVPGSVLGQARNWELLNSWMDEMIWPYVRDGQVWTEHNNQSIPAFIYRMTTVSPSFLDEANNPVDYHNVITLDAEVARWVVKACSLAFLALMCWSCRTPTQPREGWRLAAEYAVILLGMLLFSERTWKHHAVTLLLPFSVVCFALMGLRLSALWRTTLFVALCLVVLLALASSTTAWEPFDFKLGAKLAQVYGAYMWIELILLGVIVGLLGRFRRVDTDPFVPVRSIRLGLGIQRARSTPSTSSAGG